MQQPIRLAGRRHRPRDGGHGVATDFGLRNSPYPRAGRAGRSAGQPGLSDPRASGAGPLQDCRTSRLTCYARASLAGSNRRSAAARSKGREARGAMEREGRIGMEW